MRCPYCGNSDDRVVESRLVEEGEAIRRRRECEACGRRYTTYERAVGGRLVVFKRSGEREPFDRTKVVSGMMAALKNRPVAREVVESSVADLEERLRLQGDEVTTTEIGLAVLEALGKIDEVAYLRFASVYKNFTDVSDFRREMAAIRGPVRLQKGEDDGEEG